MSLIRLVLPVVLGAMVTVAVAGCHRPQTPPPQSPVQDARAANPLAPFAEFGKFARQGIEQVAGGATREEAFKGVTLQRVNASKLTKWRGEMKAAGAVTAYPVGLQVRLHFVKNDVPIYQVRALVQTGKHGVTIVDLSAEPVSPDHKVKGVPTELLKGQLTSVRETALGIARTLAHAGNCSTLPIGTAKQAELFMGKERTRSEITDAKKALAKACKQPSNFEGASVRVELRDILAPVHNEAGVVVGLVHVEFEAGSGGPELEQLRLRPVPGSPPPELKPGSPR